MNKPPVIPFDVTATTKELVRAIARHTGQSQTEVMNSAIRAHANKVMVEIILAQYRARAKA